jgi:hypothetical protein
MILKILLKNVGAPVTVTTIVDIMNVIGTCVVAGNVRRCLPEGTLVHTHHGLVPIENVKVGTLVYTSTGLAPVAEVVYQGVQEVITIRTDLGDFECTDRHKMAIIGPMAPNYTWLQARDLTPGDVLACPIHEVKGGSDVNHAWLLGFLHGAGFVSNQPFDGGAFTDRLIREVNGLGVAPKMIGTMVAFEASDLESTVIPDYILTSSMSSRQEYANGVLASGYAKVSPTFLKQVQAVYSSLGTPVAIKGTSVSFYDEPVKVKEILRTGRTCETWDISVPGSEEFIAAEGLLVHNTALIAFGEASDEFMDLKDYAKNPHRGAYGWTSNNSIFADLGMDYKDVAKRMCINGEPGIAWLDNMKEYSRMIDPPDNKDSRVMGGNPCLEQSLENMELCCVAADTRIQTRDGCPRIVEVVGKQVEVWNGTEWSAVTPFVAGANKKLYRVTLSDGSYLDCTGDHKWSILQPSCFGFKSYTETETMDLRPGAVLESFSLKQPDTGTWHDLSWSEFSDDVFELDLPSLKSFFSRMSICELAEEDARFLQLVARRCAFNAVTVLANQNGTWSTGFDLMRTQKVVSVVKLEGLFTTYCFTEPKTHKGVFNNALTHQCLVENFLNRADSMEDFHRTLKFAYLYAKTVTLGLTHWPETNRVQLRNRRIGCSVSGVAQFLGKYDLHTMNKWLDSGYKVISDWDRVYSEWMCIPRSIKMTSVKPSGTVSLLAGATPGMHYPESRFYIRRMRIARMSPLVAGLETAGYNIEPCVGSEDTTLVVEIPIDVGEGIRTIKDVSMWEQLALAANMQRWWADNQVSCTVTFNPETEGKHISAALDYFQYQLKGISFLPKLDFGAFPQMPYEEISEERFKAMGAITGSSGQDGECEKFCDGDSCLRV